MKRHIFNAFCFFCVLLLLTSCSAGRRLQPTGYNYFQKGLDSTHQITFKPLVIQPYDQLSIQISSNTLNQEQAAIFNSANVSGVNTSDSRGLNNTAVGYTVDEDGFVRLPLLGKLKVAGYTTATFTDSLEAVLSKKELIKLPHVIIRFLSIKVNVMGQVNAPGPQFFNNNRITILDALSAAGDINQYGIRDSVVIIRQEQGVQRALSVNLLDADFMTKEGFQLQQNDVLYVLADAKKIKEIKANTSVSRFTRNLQTGLSITSAASVLVSLFSILRK